MALPLSLRIAAVCAYGVKRATKEYRYYVMV